MTLDPEQRIAALRGQKSLRAETADMLYRLLRDPRRAVWEDACYMAGRRAVREAAAYDMIAELLEGPLRELRLRGVIALAAMAESRPDPVAGFFEQALADEEYGGAETGRSGDPVLLDALLGLLPRLPPAIGAELFLRAARDAREPVRAAAAASVGQWTEALPSGALIELAHDPSALVRSSLAYAVCAILDNYEAFQAATFLADDERSYIREFLARELPRIETATPLLARLAQDPEPRVRDAVHLGDGGSPRLFQPSVDDPASYRRTTVLEHDIDAHPEQTIDLLRPLLGDEDGLAVLGSLSHLARNADVAALARGLRQLLEPAHLGPEERMHAVFELLGQPRHPAAAAFKAFISYALDALRVRRPAQAVAWAAQVRAETAYVETSAWLDGLGRLCEVAEAMDGWVGALSDALTWLDQSAEAIRTDFLLPERMILLLVVERWSDMLDQEIQDQVAGVTS
jgi:hypothetical protein